MTGSEWVSAVVVPNDYVTGALLVQIIDAKSNDTNQTMYREPLAIAVGGQYLQQQEVFGNAAG
ncbi:MAG: hypothetical protein ABSG97_05430 [Sedimentisphaerales bacterium]|jgi:hypothetical protein